jgi:hypothetical protein
MNATSMITKRRAHETGALAVGFEEDLRIHPPPTGADDLALTVPQHHPGETGSVHTAHLLPVDQWLRLDHQQQEVGELQERHVLG